MKKTQILLVEDNRILREGIRAIIDRQPDMRIVGTLGGSRDTLQFTRRLKPKIILIDLGLNDDGSMKILRTLTSEFPQTSVIGMGLMPTQQDIIAFVKEGAAGFILKDASMRDVLATIRKVALGQKILPPVLTGSLFTQVIDNELRKSKGKLPPGVRMTKREREVTVLITEGLSNKEIAQRLNLSTFTVKSHVHNILEKLALHTRLEIAASTRPGPEP
jgi:DNA-binding NarL/FixJ family response regulator